MARSAGCGQLNCSPRAPARQPLSCPGLGQSRIPLASGSTRINYNARNWRSPQRTACNIRVIAVVWSLNIRVHSRLAETKAPLLAGRFEFRRNEIFESLPSVAQDLLNKGRMV